ncbi:hypothetical protein F6B93_05020 [Mycobacterium spongiae]|uniref:FAD-binding domain-containing protein n=2 Tax=Mycobacterium spongiae TaxID=886343 RepID=A0A975JVN0_9MYCO|nr:hypothetical protein F6B93_05020 [Mycobacterium spongiae]
MIIVEKAVHPRHKLCGGAVTKLGTRTLQSLGLPTPPPIPHAIVRDAHLKYRQLTIHVRRDPMLWVAHRDEFDHWLVNVAKEHGIVICENQLVENIVFEKGIAFVKTREVTYRTKVVVGADGSRGISRRVLYSPTEARGRVARVLEVVGPTSLSTPTFDGLSALFDFTDVSQDLQGYAWDFPSFVQGQAHFNRGIYDARAARQRPKGQLPKLLEKFLREHHTNPDSVGIQGHPIHWFSPRNRLAIPGMLVVGDSAGAEPLFGEGIGPALAGGAIAANAIQAAFERNDFRFRGYRWQLLSSRLGAYLMWRWYVAWWSYRLSGHPWFMRTLWVIAAIINRTARGK